MKRLALGLLFILTLSVALVAAAAAAPPNSCDDKPEGHPQCSTTTTSPPTTEPPLAACEDVMTIPAARSGGIECLWTPQNPIGTTSGVVGVTTSQELRSLVVFVRDSEPGDICVLDQLHRPEGTYFESAVPLAYPQGDPSEYYRDHRGHHGAGRSSGSERCRWRAVPSCRARR